MNRPYRAGLGLPEAVVIRSGPLPANATSVLDGPLDLLSAQRAWREWNINPAKHGPERMTGPPVFVPSQQTYNELGRCITDGVDVHVEGIRREVESGEKVAEWYMALSSGQAEAGPSSHQATLSTDAGPSRSPSSVRRRRVHRSEWFIRRALASSSSTPTPPATPPSSIGSLLNIPSKPRIKPAQYVLGPDNVGYTILRDRLGWEGGGLGRSADCESESSDEIVPLDAKGNVIIDLTADSDDDLAPKAGGPGRTAPIATALKLDRLGIGHRRSRAGGTRKVTHTAEEIERERRRAKYKKVDKLELGKRGKVKWKDKDRKERDERRRLMSLMHE